MTTLKIAQAPATLLQDGQKPTGPPPTPETATPALADAPKAAYSEDWTRSIIRYFCNLAAAEWGPEMAASEIEIQLLTPPLQAVLNRHAPDVASGADERASLGFVALVIVVMGCRRSLIVRHKARDAAAKGAPTSSNGAAPASNGAAPEKPREKLVKAAPPPALELVPESKGTIMGGLIG